jgi:hypothetical protein
LSLIFIMQIPPAHLFQRGELCDGCWLTNSIDHDAPPSDDSCPLKKNEIECINNLTSLIPDHMLTNKTPCPDGMLIQQPYMDKKLSAHINYIRRVAAILLLIAVIDGGQVCLAGQSRTAPPELTPSNANLIELEQLIGNAGDIYDKVKTNHWKHLDKKLNSIVKVEQLLPSATPENDMPYYKNLTGVTSDLERAIASQDRIVAMKSANKVMMLGARLAEAHNSPVPINVAVIGYCGRKLEILSETENVLDLSDTVAKLHLSWQQLIPLVTANGGFKEVKRFAEIMRRLESAKAPDEYGRLAASAVEEIEIIEKFFIK